MMKKIAAIFVFTIILFLANAQEQSYFLHGVASYQSQDYKTAIEQFDKSVEINENQGKSIIYRGMSYYQQGDMKNAKTDFLAAVKFNLPEASLELSKLYAKEGDAGQTIKYLKDYIKNTPDLNTITLLKSKYFTSINESAEWFRFISEYTHPEKWDIIENADYLAKTGKYSEAQKTIDNVLMNNPDDVDYLLAKSEIYELKGNTTLAEYEAEIARQKQPENLKILNRCTRLAMINSKYDKAIEYSVLLKKLMPENFETSLDLAKAYLFNNEYSKALTETKYYMNYFPESKPGNFRLAECYFSMGDYTSSLKSLNKLMQGKKIEPEWYLLRGKTYFQTHTYKYAAQDLSMCLDLTPNSKDANYYLGLAHLEMNDLDLACYYLNRAYKLGDNRAFKHMQNCP